MSKLRRYPRPPTPYIESEAELMNPDNQNTEAEKTRLSMAARIARLDEKPQENPATEASTSTADPIDAIGADDRFASIVPDEFSTPPAEDGPLQDAPVPAEGAYEAKGRPKRRYRKLWLIPVVLVALLAAAYGGGVYYFNEHCLPNTMVDGADVSGMTKSEVAASIESQVADYVISVTGDGVDLNLTASDLSLGYDGEAYAANVMSRTSAWQWPLEISGSRSYTLQKTIKYDSDKVVSALAPFVEQSRSTAEKTAKEATVTYDSASKAFVLQIDGDTSSLDGDAAAAKVCSALDALQTTVELGDDCMNTGYDFSSFVVKANSCLSAAPTLTLAGTTVAEIGADQIASWLKVGNDLGIEIDSAAVTAWCKGDLSKACDTVGTSRTYTRADGQTFTVAGGEYGWNIDGASTADKIISALEGGQKTIIEIPTLSKGETWVLGGQDWGKRYIDIDLSEQHARMYDDSGSLIWESDVVTGDTTEDHATPTGVYTMNSNRASDNVELRGEIDASTGEPEYISYVDYWMPFIGNSYALHDASWRSSFGGTIYCGNGSHGCVNLPVDKAAELWNLCRVGDTVVVHN